MVKESLEKKIVLDNHIRGEIQKREDNYISNRVITYGISFLVSPFITGYLVGQDIIYGKPEEKIFVESQEQSTAFMRDIRDESLSPNRKLKTPILDNSRFHETKLPILLFGLFLTIPIHFADKELSEYLGCDSSPSYVFNDCVSHIWEVLPKK